MARRTGWALFVLPFTNSGASHRLCELVWLASLRSLTPRPANGPIGLAERTSYCGSIDCQLLAHDSQPTERSHKSRDAVGGFGPEASRLVAYTGPRVPESAAPSLQLRKATSMQRAACFAMHRGSCIEGLRAVFITDIAFPSVDRVKIKPRAMDATSRSQRETVSRRNGVGPTPRR